MLPTPSQLLRELWAVHGMVTAVGRSALEAYPRAGEGAPVLLVPGFLAGDRSLTSLAAHLADAGYRPHPAGIARNVDCSEAATAHLSARLEGLAAHHGRPVAVVGHSRGGMLARVLARRRPELVACVITLGSPHRDPLAVNPWLLAQALGLAGAGTIGVRGLVRLSCAAGTCCRGFRGDLAAAVPRGVAYLSIYSRRDGVVDWRACLDPAARHVEVAASHIGMAVNAEVYRAVADTLAFRRSAAARASAARWRVEPPSSAVSSCARL
jgi:pimeloyl-ACP methyl ester carboxylesterase